MSIDEYLNGFGEQDTNEEKPIDVVRNPRVDEICRMYEEFLHLMGHDGEMYQDTFNLVEDLQPTFKDIRDFSIALKEKELEVYFRCTGYFLALLINISKEKNFEILTEHLEGRMDYLGNQNVKNIIVKGHVGNYLGIQMINGSIIVHGNAGDSVGHCIEGGKIEVNGDISSVSENFKGGEIYHKGVRIYP